MDNKLSAFLTDEKNPKPLRYLLLVGVICFVEWVLLGIAAMSAYMAIKLPLFALAALMLLVGVRLVLRIHRSQAAPEEEA